MSGPYITFLVSCAHRKSLVGSRSTHLRALSLRFGYQYYRICPRMEIYICRSLFLTLAVCFFLSLSVHFISFPFSLYKLFRASACLKATCFSLSMYFIASFILFFLYLYLYLFLSLYFFCLHPPLCVNLSPCLSLSLSSSLSEIV